MTMKKSLFIFFIFICLNTDGQIKQVEIWSNPGTGKILQAAFADDDTLIIFYANDSRYSHITSLIRVFYGTPEDFYKWLGDLEEFGKNKLDAKTDLTKEINGQLVTIRKAIGSMNDYYLSEIGGNGYSRLLAVELPKFKNKFIQWAEKNNISYQ